MFCTVALLRMAIRVGVQIAPQQLDYAELRGLWLEVEEIGVDTIFTWDHFFPLSGAPDGKHFECWTQLAAMAEVTERAGIGALVTCNSYRNPNLLADMARTVDHISGGRLVLGIGAGWSDRDFVEYGYDLGTATSRTRALDSGLRTIRERLGKLNPLPVHGTVPILVGGGGEKVMLRVVAEHADIWNWFGAPQELAEKSAVLDDHCREIGRDPAQIERSGALTVDQLEHADEYVAAGITYLVYDSDFGKPVDLGVVRELVAWRDARR